MTQISIKNHIFLMSIMTLVISAIITGCKKSDDPPPSGPTWLTYTTTNSSIPDNEIWAIEVYNNDVWVSHINSVSKFSNGAWTTVNLALSGETFDIAVDKTNHLWFADDEGLTEYDGTSFISYSKDDYNLSTCAKIAVDENNTKWVALPWKGLLRWVNSTDYYIVDLTDKKAGSLSIDNQNRVYAGLHWEPSGGNYGLYRHGPSPTTYTTLNSGLPSSIVMDVLCVEAKTWVATDGGGLASFDGISSWTVYNTGNSDIPSNRVYCLEKDAANNIWMGTFDAGLCKFDGSQWTVFNSQNSPLPQGQVVSLKHDGTNTLWIGTYYSAGAYGTGLTKFTY